MTQVHEAPTTADRLRGLTALNEGELDAAAIGQIREVWALVVEENESELDLVTASQAQAWQSMRESMDRRIDDAETPADVSAIIGILTQFTHSSGNDLRARRAERIQEATPVPVDEPVAQGDAGVFQTRPMNGKHGRRRGPSRGPVRNFLSYFWHDILRAPRR